MHVCVCVQKSACLNECEERGMVCVRERTRVHVRACVCVCAHVRAHTLHHSELHLFGMRAQRGGWFKAKRKEME